MLPCKLTDGETLQMSRERSYIGRQLDQVNDELEQLKERHKQEIDLKKGRIAELSGQDKQLRIAIDVGAIDRLTKCQREFNWSQTQVRETRIDLMPVGELSVRAMTPTELDEGLPNWAGTAFEGVKVKETDEADPHEGERPGDIT